LYSYLYTDGKVDLSNIDFLKVSRGGLDGASGEEFLNLLSPKNSVIFTGYGRAPSALVINRLHYANEEGVLYRTDVHGDISVIINGENTYELELGGE
jgi:beta-lactamase superfamily II metal-dependent hydrolase